MSIWRNIVHGSNIDLVGNSVDERLPEIRRVLEAQVAAVYVVRQRERELSLMEVRRVRSIIQTCQRLMIPLDHFTVADPFEHELVWENALIVNFKPILVELQLS